MKDKLAMCLPPALVALLVLVNSCGSRADAAPPAPRLARQLPPEAAARAAARREYADAMRALLRALGVAPSPSATETIRARAAWISAAAAAISNRADLAAAVAAARAESIAREKIEAPALTVPVSDPAKK